MVPSRDPVDGERRSPLPALLLLGLWLGTLDGALVLWWRPELGGSLAHRFLTLLVAASSGALALVGLYFAAWLPVRWLARARGSTEESRRTSLATSGWLAIAVILGIERLGLVRYGDLGRMVVLTLVVAALALVLATLLAFLAGRLSSTAPGWRSRRGWGLAWLAVVVFVPLLGWRGPGPSAVTERPNFVLVSIDTLRADHLGAYGYSRDTSPHLDAVAEEGTLFETVYAPANWTLTSHASLLTGLDPLTHGVLTPNGRLSETLDTVSERLEAQSYRTAAWVGMGPFSYVGAERRLDQGFALYEHAPHARSGFAGLLPHALDRVYRRMLLGKVDEARHQVDAVLRWLAYSRQEPFFAFLHFYDVHGKAHRLPYDAPAPFRYRFCPDAAGRLDGCAPGGPCAIELLAEVARGRAPRPSPAETEIIECLYDGAIAYLDAELGRFFAALERLGLDERTVVVVTSDHGEAFFEHGMPLHGTLYEETVRIPLIVRGPGVTRGERVEAVTRAIDVAATLLELAGAAAEGTQGVSLVPALRGRFISPTLPALTVGSRKDRTLSLRRGRFKYVRHLDGRGEEPPREELYDLTADPDETKNLAADPRRAALLARLRAELESIRRQARAAQRRLGNRVGDDGTLDVPEDERRRLRALGYLD
jgi:arylsulfatase A-like enzyme